MFNYKVRFERSFSSCDTISHRKKIMYIQLKKINPLKKKIFIPENFMNTEKNTHLFLTNTFFFHSFMIHRVILFKTLHLDHIQSK